MSIYQKISPYLFRIDAEKMHDIAEWTIKNIAPLPLVQDYLVSQYCVFDESLHTQVAGMRFYNPVGLAAGFDKNATMVKGLSALGFGFLELGTITQAPQSGNPKPRLFRYIQEKSLQNEMGFNNQGSLKIAERLEKIYPYSIPLGINVGKNKIIAQSDSLKNYENVLLDCLNIGDYYVFNLSSPNTPKLRDLQNVSFVQELFAMAKTHTQKPIFIKISPDMKPDDMLKVVEMSIKCGASGIIATNTTIDYSVLNGAKESGGVSGEALKEKSREILRILSEAFFGKTTFISVGGISDANEAYQRIRLGASLVQVFSGLIFQGPTLCREINEGLLQLLKNDGFTSLNEAIGYDIINKTKRVSKKPKTEAIEKTSIETQIQQDTPKKRGRKPKIVESVGKMEESKAEKKPRKTRTTKTESKSATQDSKKQTNTQNLGKESIPKKRGRKSKVELLALSLQEKPQEDSKTTPKVQAGEDSTNHIENLKQQTHSQVEQTTAERNQPRNDALTQILVNEKVDSQKE
ncbi:quinone-dependent dihydroorotate dehydrogenase [Helicobacter japonicus]|uniref:Dihydroorotate dehydrogenase (quinone) n=2 Tax=Helicobacter japonicus TaxID=425400 RepID=A0A4V6YSE6_9HELI|nr:quinone-dependent dihydroorotate dehydrogenase [Helicobacter japonicus]TLE00683.1 quinone-dependent dihydroorotate dehydrogenase [Helicobacter japonicus]